MTTREEPDMTIESGTVREPDWGAIRDEIAKRRRWKNKENHGG